MSGKGILMRASTGMRPVLSMAMVAIALCAVCAQAHAWPWSKKNLAEDGISTDLKAVMSAPETFDRHTITFECWFAMQGKLFKHFNTRFNPGEHTNFAVWPVEAKLWRKADRRNVLPTLYLDKSNAELFQLLRNLKPYERIIVTGRVVNTYAGLPWILVIDIRQAHSDTTTLTETALVSIRRGLDLMNEGKYKLAARNFEIALENGTPEEHAQFVKQNLADSYAEADMADKAIALYEEILDMDKQDAADMLALAKLYLKANMPQKALDAAQKSITISADYPEAYAIVGEAYGKLGKLKEAIESSEMAINTPGISEYEKAMAYVYRARTLAAAEKYADAVRSYAESLSSSELAGVAWLRQEIGGLYEGRFDATGTVSYLEDAIREYRNANVLSNNNDADGLVMLSRALFKQAKANDAASFDESKKLLDEAMNLDSMHVMARLLKGEIVLAEGNPEAAEAIFAEVASAESVDAMMALAKTYEKMNRPGKAVAAYQRVLDADPNNGEALDRTADLAEKSHDLQAARAAFRRLVEIKPKEYSYRWKLGQISLQLGHFAEAVEHLTAASVAPGSLGEDAGVEAAKALVLLGDMGGSEATLRSVLKRNPDHIGALAALSSVLADQNRRIAEAVRLAETAVGKAPKDARALDAYGWAMVRSGDYGKALSVLDKIEELDMTRAIWYHKAAAYFFNKDFNNARWALQKVMEPVDSDEHQVEVDRLKKAGAELEALLQKAESSAMNHPQPESAPVAEAEAAVAAVEAQTEVFEVVEEPLPAATVTVEEFDEVAPLPEAASEEDPSEIAQVEEEEGFSLAIPGIGDPRPDPADVSALRESSKAPAKAPYRNTVRNLPGASRTKSEWGPELEDLEMGWETPAVIDLGGESLKIIPEGDALRRIEPDMVGSDMIDAMEPLAEEDESLLLPESAPAPVEDIQPAPASSSTPNLRDLPEWAL